MSIAQIIVQVEEAGEGNYQIRLSYSGGNDLETEKGGFRAYRCRSGGGVGGIGVSDDH